MELYTLDNRLRRNAVVDRYESLIWTDRYTQSGDFELVIPSSSSTRELLQTGQLLALNESDRVMQVDTVEDVDDSEGRSLLTVKGPSLEAFMAERSARPYFGAKGTTPVLGTVDADGKWTVHDTPGNVARAIFKRFCRDGALSASDVMPYMTDGTLFPADTIPEPDQVVDISLEYSDSTVYSAIKAICDAYGLGFRISRNYDTSQLFFNIYMGRDRTSKQNTSEAVIFSQTLGNLNDIKYIKSTSGYKNVAYVMAPKGALMVYAEGSTNVAGFDRRVMNVDASDVTLNAGDALTAELTRLGREALANQKSMNALDGQISQTSTAKYNLGDMVEMRNPDGVAQDMKVTEQIFSSDASGDKKYPTLSADLFITPGSWFSSAGSHIWNDATQTWDEAAP